MKPIWVRVTTVQENMDTMEVPVNLNTIVTYARCADPTFPTAKTVLYPTGSHIKSIPIKESVEEFEALMEQTQ
jgi:hypothetical protein